jgi:hypothetical protein
MKIKKKGFFGLFKGVVVDFVNLFWNILLFFPINFLVFIMEPKFNFFANPSRISILNKPPKNLFFKKINLPFQ